jgi:hypothetical protein
MEILDGEHPRQPVLVAGRVDEFVAKGGDKVVIGVK